MKKNFVNRCHVEGLLYQHKLEAKVTGENSKAPGTSYITGTIDIATDNNLTNIVSIHFTYVTPVTSKNKENRTYTALSNIVNGVYGSVMEHGEDKAVKLSVDTSFGINDFWDRSGKDVHAIRLEGGFVSLASALNEDENKRNTFTCDMVINHVYRVEADAERQTEEYVNVGGYIFDFRNAVIPIDFRIFIPGGMDYFEGLNVSNNNPAFTSISGNIIATTVIVKKEEETPWHTIAVREVKNTRKAYAITYAQPELYEWDSEDTITAADMSRLLSERQVYLATKEKSDAEYRANQQGSGAFGAAAATTAPVEGGFKF